MTYKKNLKRVQDGLAGLIQEGSADVSASARTVAQKGRKLHASVQERGGYCAVAKEGLEKAGAGLSQAFRDYIGRVERGYKELKSNVCDTEGNFDYEKAKTLIADQTSAAARFGRRTVDRIAELTSQGAERAETEWRTLFPSREELQDRYQGIGIDSESPVLFRPDYENCLSFYNQARRILPRGLKVRPQILDAIKAKCCTNAGELVQAYEKAGAQDQGALIAVRKYFSSN